jgi:hypothetical protein
MAGSNQRIVKLTGLRVNVTSMAKSDAAGLCGHFAVSLTRL